MGGGGPCRREGGESEETIKEKETPERVPELNRRLNRINIELRERERVGWGVGGGEGAG